MISILCLIWILNLLDFFKKSKKDTEIIFNVIIMQVKWNFETFFFLMNVSFGLLSK